MADLISQGVTAQQANDIFVSQVFPVPQSLLTLQNTSRGLLKDFALAMNATCPGCPLTFGALEGFVAGSFVVQVWLVLILEVF
jgi:hypothetical protein